MVYETSVWKVKFFKNNDDNGGAMQQAIDTKTESQITIHSQTQKNGRMWGNVIPSYLLKLLEKNHGLYEVVTSFPHKVYFDIDKKGEASCDYIETIKQTILQFFPNADMAISGSINETKTSYHIVLQNYSIHNETERTTMKHIVKHINETINDSFDWKVYTKNRNMKCINQSKDDGRVQEIIENEDFKAHCITCFINNYALPFIELPYEVKEAIMISKSSGAFDLGALPKIILTTPDDIDIVTITPEQILSLLPLNPSFDHTYTHQIARFCFYNNLSFDLFLSWLTKKHNPLTHQVITKWQHHFSRLHAFPPVSIDKAKTILCYFYPHLKKDIHFRKFSQSFELPTEAVKKIETITPSCFNDENKYLLFNVGMGGGKTAQTISYLTFQQNFLWIAPNRALGINTKKRFEQESIDVEHYETFNTKSKKAGDLSQVQKLICCLNSIHYLGTATYEVIVIDEIETLLDKFLGDFLEQGKKKLKQEIWNIFLNLFRNSQKVILLDAFITTKTINFLKSIDAECRLTIFERAYEPQTRNVKHISSTEAAIHDLVQKVNEGSKVFVFYPFKKRSRDFMSMEELFNVITLSTRKNGIFYNADVDDSTKAGLKDVNASWEEVKFVITNNVITCGVNYDQTDFDYVYVFIADHNLPRDIIQVSYRVRHLSTGIIKINYLGKMNQRNSWIDDCVRMDCPLYSNLFNDILIERKAPIKRALQLFCVKARYTQDVEHGKIDQALQQEIAKITEAHVGISYHHIPDIDFSEAEHIESLCMAMQATMMDKFTLRKYYFKKSFVNADHNMVAALWDDNKFFFLKQIAKVFRDENHLFNKIAEHNKTQKLFPVDIRKIKFSEELKDLIFSEFKFKYVNRDSSTIKIAVEIYNTFFGFVYTAEYCDKKVHYSLYDFIPNIYDFCCENLILEQQTGLVYGCRNLDDDVAIEI